MRLRTQRVLMPPSRSTTATQRRARRTIQARTAGRKRSRITQDPTALAGSAPSVDASQRSYAAYVDLEADVLPRLTLGVAARFEDYSSFGSETVGKVQARFEINDVIALRATASTGFHAPSPGQSNVETLSTTFIPGTTTQVQIGTYRVTSAVAQYFGATTLEPEESTNLSFGIVLTPIDRLLITIDAYRIEVDDRIGISQQFTVTQADIDALADLAIVGVGGTVQYFTNGFDTEDRGRGPGGHLRVPGWPGQLADDAGVQLQQEHGPEFRPAGHHPGADRRHRTLCPE